MCLTLSIFCSSIRKKAQVLWKFVFQTELFELRTMRNEEFYLKVPEKI